jgi:hypothetical protein
MSWEEANEFARFQKERGQRVVPFMKMLPVVFSDQPYQHGQERKRAIQTEPTTKVRLRKPSRPRQQPRPNRIPHMKYLSGSPLTVPRDNEAPRSGGNDQEWRAMYWEKGQQFNQGGKSVNFRSIRRLFGDTLSETEDEEEILNDSPDISLAEPLVHQHQFQAWQPQPSGFTI